MTWGWGGWWAGRRAPSWSTRSPRRTAWCRHGDNPMEASLRPSLRVLVAAGGVMSTPDLDAQRTAKPPLHGRHWMAITGKPLSATAGALIFARGGNAVDAACATLAAGPTMW